MAILARVQPPLESRSGATQKILMPLKLYVGKVRFNYDHFSFYVQKIEPKDGFIAVKTRRRDGYTRHAIDEHSIFSVCPFHVDNSQKIGLDQKLANALFQLWNKQNKEFLLLSEAIFYFLMANKDSFEISGYQECVLLVSAIERLYNCSMGKEKDLQNALNSVFSGFKTISKKQSRFSKIKKYNDDDFLIDLWIKDFYQLRSEYAHGKLTSNRISFWSQAEHLLLGSFIFPVLVKHKLSDIGFYTLSEEDEFKLFVFEHFLNEELFNKPEDQMNSSDYPWNRIWSDKRFEFAIRKTIYKLGST
jgi:hypothetical protein